MELAGQIVAVGVMTVSVIVAARLEWARRPPVIRDGERWRAAKRLNKQRV